MSRWLTPQPHASCGARFLPLACVSHNYCRVSSHGGVLLFLSVFTGPMGSGGGETGQRSASMHVQLLQDGDKDAV